jgi:hypothetical protein
MKQNFEKKSFNFSYGGAKLLWKNGSWSAKCNSQRFTAPVFTNKNTGNKIYRFVTMVY